MDTSDFYLFGFKHETEGSSLFQLFGKDCLKGTERNLVDEDGKFFFVVCVDTRNKE